jgi:hypothetical protein
MGKQTRLMELPTRMLEVALGSERRWKRVAIVSIAFVGVLGTAAYFGIQRLSSQSSDALATDVGSLETCLLGAPLAAGETPDARVRGVQLAVLGVARSQRVKPGELPWPQRCTTFASAVHDKLGDQDPLGAATAALAKALKEDAPSLEEPVAKAWEAIETKGITPKRDPAVSAAPPPLAARWSRTEFAKVPTFLGGDFALPSLRVEPHPAGKLRFIVDEVAGGGPKLCTVGPADAEATCVAVGEGAAKKVGKLALVGTTADGATPVVVADGGLQGVFRLGEAEPITTSAVHDVAVDAKGTVALLVGAPAKDVEIDLRPAPRDGKAVPGSRSVAVPDPEIAGPGQAALLWGRLAYQGVKPAQKPHLFIRPLGDTLGPPQDLGEIADPAPDARAAEEKLVDGCRSIDGGLAAIRVRGAKSDQVSVSVGGRWSALFTAGTVNGELVCHDTDVTLTQIEHDLVDGRDQARVKVSRCAAGCTTTEVKLSTVLAETDVFPVDVSSFAAADVGGKVALVWSAGRAGIRLRVGAPDQLASAPEALIFDGFEHGATRDLPSFNGLRVIPFGDRAMVFLATKSGVRAFRLDPDGKLTPITAKG